MRVSALPVRHRNISPSAHPPALLASEENSSKGKEKERMEQGRNRCKNIVGKIKTAGSNMISLFSRHLHQEPSKPLLVSGRRHPYRELNSRGGKIPNPRPPGAHLGQLRRSRPPAAHPRPAAHSTV